MALNIFHLIVTSDIDGAMAGIRTDYDVTPTGKNRGFGPDGKQYLVINESRLPEAVLGMEISGYEYRLSDSHGVHDATLDTLMPT